MSSMTQTQPRILPCPNCGEMIYSDTTQCRFCSAPVDVLAAEAGANLQEKVNDACNQAKWIRNTAGAMWVFMGLGIIFSFGRIGTLFCFVAVPLSLIYWQLRYGSLKTPDPDYKKAKRDRLIALLIWLPAGLIQLLLLVLL
jgi:hypothetical protein